MNSVTPAQPEQPTGKAKLTALASSAFPDLQALTAGLASVFGGDGAARIEVTVLARRPNYYASTFPSEVVTCRFEDERELRLLCKYAAGRSHRDYGHRGDVAYEAAVYRHVLGPLQASTPRFYGSYIDRAGGESWLLIEYLEGAVGLEESPSPPGAMLLAARWVGRFHAVAEARLAGAPTAFLNAYDREYYLRWVHRTSLLAGHWHQRLLWLGRLCERAAAFEDLLLAQPVTIIHGEYVPHNLLVRGGQIYPIDWESAAIAMGEIDLIGLTDKWPTEIARECEREYRRARWPAGPPANFERRLDLARLYWDFRWLGDRPEWTASEKVGPRFEHLRSAGERLGLI
jgi:hypothetical protein